MLEIKNLEVNIEGKKILKGLSLEIKEGEVVALMGPNGCGKSTLSYVIMGHPDYVVDKGEILFNGENILELSPDQRAKLGLFLSFQYPLEIEGITLSNFLKTALNNILESKGKTKLNVYEFRKLLYEKLDLLKIPREFSERYLNEGFSGGEKKKAEILQMTILNPFLAVLDETDSGLDIDSLQIVANGVNSLRNDKFSALVITHYQRILNYINPDKVYIIVDGKVVKSGGKDLAKELEKEGYQKYFQN